MGYKLDVKYRKNILKDSVGSNLRVAAQYAFDMSKMSEFLAELYCSHTRIMPSAGLLQAENRKIL